VQPNVVLTAGHLVFNDQTLSYANQVYWHFQKEVGIFIPEPLEARAVDVLDGYAAQRTNDLGGLGGQTYLPDQSSPQSRNLDVAALYFEKHAAGDGGGYGGFLPSDSVPNSWLSSTAQKMLVGYPVDGSLFGDASIIAGQMYQTDPQPYPLSQAADPVANQQVYTANWFLGYPGNSGGPLYVQFNGYYYPAGVYLGTINNGTYQSVVRAIDSSVVNLITLAAARGTNNVGTNNTGGGVITFIPNSAINANNLAYVQVVLAPPEAVQAGGGWRLQGDPTYGSDPKYSRSISTNGALIEFNPIPGWNSPEAQTNHLNAGDTPNVFTATYIATPARLGYSLGEGLTLFGASALKYRIYYTNNFGSPTTNWTLLTNVTLTNSSQVIGGTKPLPSGTRFFRALKLP